MESRRSTINHRLVWTQGIFSVDKNRVWFVPYWINVLCVYNLKIDKMEKIIQFPNRAIDSAGYFNVKKIDDLVVIIPAFEKQIYVYDTIKEVMLSFDFPKMQCRYEKFMFCSVWDQHVYFFPVGYEYVVKIDLREQRVTIINAIDDKCNMFVAMTQIDENVYLVNETNRIYVFNMLEENFKIIVSENSNRKYRTITNQGAEKLFLSDIFGNLYLYYLNDLDCEKTYMAGNVPYDSSECVTDFIFLMPIYEKDYFVKFDISTKNVSKIYIDKGDNYIQWPHTVFSKIVFENGILYFFSTQYQMFYTYNVETGEETTHKLEMPILDNQQIEKIFLQKGTSGNVKEGSGQHATLEKFILLAKNVSLVETQEKTIGEKIYRKLQEVDEA